SPRNRQRQGARRRPRAAASPIVGRLDPCRCSPTGRRRAAVTASRGYRRRPFIVQKDQRGHMNAPPAKPLIGRLLDPAESLGEILFGLIMVLTVTMGARLLTRRDALDGHEIVVAAVGCNIAWGIIDAVLFVLGTLYQRSQKMRLVRAVRGAPDRAAALA